MSNHDKFESADRAEAPYTPSAYEVWRLLIDEFGLHEDSSPILAALEESDGRTKRELAELISTTVKLEEEMSQKIKDLGMAVVARICPTTYLQHDVSNLTDSPPVNDLTDRVNDLRDKVDAII